MVTLQLLTIAMAGICFSIGGWHILFFRRWVMPTILTLCCFYITHSYWSISMMLSIVFLSLGYGDNSKFTHFFGPAWSRAIWGLFVGLSLSLWSILTGHIAWYWFVTYLIQGMAIEPLCKRLNQIGGDFIIGCGMGSIVLLIR